MQLREQFLEKAAKYFDASVTGDELARKQIAVDMSILVKRERALYLAKRQPKQIDPKPQEAQTAPLVTDPITYCKCHPEKTYDSTKFVGCHSCFLTGFTCGDERKKNEE